MAIKICFPKKKKKPSSLEYFWCLNCLGSFTRSTLEKDQAHQRCESPILISHYYCDRYVGDDPGVGDTAVLPEILTIFKQEHFSSIIPRWSQVFPDLSKIAQLREKKKLTSGYWSRWRRCPRDTARSWNPRRTPGSRTTGASGGSDSDSSSWARSDCSWPGRPGCPASWCGRAWPAGNRGNGSACPPGRRISGPAPFWAARRSAGLERVRFEVLSCGCSGRGGSFAFRGLCHYQERLINVYQMKHGW